MQLRATSGGIVEPASFSCNATSLEAAVRLRYPRDYTPRPLVPVVLTATVVRSDDLAWTALPAVNLTTTFANVDVAALRVRPAGALSDSTGLGVSLSEGSSSQVFVSASVVLEAPLVVRAVVPATAAADVTVTPASITLPAGPMSTTVALPFFTVTALSDNVSGNTRQRTVQFTADGIEAPGELAVVVLDAGSVETGVSAIVVPEGGSSVVTLRRSGAATAPITYTVAFVRTTAASASDVVTVSPTTVTLTSLATVNVTFAENGVSTSVGPTPAGSLTFTPVGTGGLPVAPVAVALLDNDVPLLRADELKEGVKGGVVRITVRLGTGIATPLSVSAAIAGAAVTSLQFPAAAGPQAADLTVTLPNDNAVSGVTLVQVVLSVSGGPSVYRNWTAVTTVRVSDNSVRGVSAVVAGVAAGVAASLTEGADSGAVVTISLTGAPATPVLVTVVPVEGVVASVPALTFAARSTASQTITFRAPEDRVPRAAGPVAVTLVVRCEADPTWDRTLSLPFTIVDNDVAAVVISAVNTGVAASPVASFAETTEGAATPAQFAVRLSAAPATGSAVTVRFAVRTGVCVASTFASATATVTASPAPVSGGAAAPGTVPECDTDAQCARGFVCARGNGLAPVNQTLTFTAASFDVPQTVTVAAIDDSVLEGTTLRTVVATAMSTSRWAAVRCVVCVSVCVCEPVLCDGVWCGVEVSGFWASLAPGSIALHLHCCCVRVCASFFSPAWGRTPGPPSTACRPRALCACWITTPRLCA
jgi:hypothetical protein